MDDENRRGRCYAVHSERDADRLKHHNPTSTPLAMSRAESPYTQRPPINFEGFSWPSSGTHNRKEETEQEKEERTARLSGAVRTMLECVGEDPYREGLLNTPTRYTKALLFFTKGYEEDLREILNGAVFYEDHSELVMVTDIEISSLCEHHLVPFTGKVRKSISRVCISGLTLKQIHIGYIPNGRMIGLSKLARIAEMFSRRLQVQERLTKQIALALQSVLQPQGVAVVIKCSHLCMWMRGVEKTGAATTTMSMLGCMESTPRLREEFLSFIKLQ